MVQWLAFHDHPVWLNLALFAAAATATGVAGMRLTRHVDEVSRRTEMAEVFVGALLLGGITSLPEVATTVTAASVGNAELAVSNVFGGVAMQVAILAGADAAIGRRALSSLTGRPDVLLQGVLLTGLLAVAAIAILTGEPSALPVGLWSSGILLVAVAAFAVMHRSRPEKRWEALDEAGGRVRLEAGASPRPFADLSNGSLALRVAAAGAVVLVAGFVVARTGDALAEQTGIGSNLVGFVLVAVATSLPEVSTTLTAARIGAYGLAFSNIFGTNIFDVSLIWLADVFYLPGPVLAEAGSFAAVGAVLGALLTLIYLGGIIERRDRVIWRLGFDSALVIVVYAAGLVVLRGLGGAGA